MAFEILFIITTNSLYFLPLWLNILRELKTQDPFYTSIRQGTVEKGLPSQAIETNPSPVKSRWHQQIQA